MSGLVIPNIECVESRDGFGRFLAEPLETGFGVTLGNALRRVLLAFLPGAAITRIKIDGVHHEFSTMPNIREDITELLLNIKSVRLKPISGQPGRMELEVEGKREVHAGDIRATTDFEVVNPELYLVTLDSPEAKLRAELDVEMGQGYREAESSDNLPVDTIPVDAIFTPVRKVNFYVEPAHVRQKTSRERLFLEVWTDGTITPQEALSQAASILVEQLTPFAGYSRVFQAKAERELVTQVIPDEKYNMPVEQLSLSVRTMNCLRRAGITTAGELISRGEKELMSLRNFGQKSKQEIEEKLNALGLSLSHQPSAAVPAEKVEAEPAKKKESKTEEAPEE